MKCTLHIGTAKSGTTSIQSFFYQNRHMMRRRYGIVVPQFEKAFLTRGNHKALAFYAGSASTYCGPRWGRMNEQEARSWVERFETSFEKGMRTEFSDSLLSRMMTALPGVPDAAHYFFSSEQLHSRIHKREYVEKVCGLLSRYFDEIKMVVFLRPQSALALSRYTNSLRGGASMGDYMPSVFPDKLHKHYYHYDLFLEWWREVLGPEAITIRVMDDAAASFRDAVSEMCSIMEVDPSSMKSQSKRLNTAIGAHAADFLNLRNRGEHEGRFAMSRPLRQRITRAVSRLGEKGRKLPTQEEARAFDAIFADGNARVAEMFGLKQPLFEVDYSRYPEVSEITPASELHEILAQIKPEIEGRKMNAEELEAWKQFSEYVLEQSES